METSLAREHSARQRLLDLACEAGLYRAGGGRPFYELVKQARNVARAAVHEGVSPFTPITALFLQQREKHGGGETLGWHFHRAYGCANASIDPERFFTITYANNFVTIESRAVAGASGEISFNDRSVDAIFKCAGYDTPGSCSNWAADEHPVGSSPRLLRMDDDDHYVGPLRLEAGDLHPCRGSLYFGAPDQESEQLAAFCRLEAKVRALFAEKSPTESERTEAKSRANAIIGQADSF